jgi:hypothetical protein
MDVMLLVTRMPVVEALSTACNTAETGRLDESGENHCELGRAYRQPGICPLRKQIERLLRSNADR